jgi:hypothetical protein
MLSPVQLWGTEESFRVVAHSEQEVYEQVNTFFRNIKSLNETECEHRREAIQEKPNSGPRAKHCF